MSQEVGTGRGPNPWGSPATAEQGVHRGSLPCRGRHHTSLPDARLRSTWSSRGATITTGLQEGGEGRQGGHSGASAELAGTALGTLLPCPAPQSGSAGASAWVPGTRHFGRGGRVLVRSRQRENSPNPFLPGPARGGIWSAELLVVTTRGNASHGDSEVVVCGSALTHSPQTLSRGGLCSLCLPCPEPQPHRPPAPTLSSSALRLHPPFMPGSLGPRRPSAATPAGARTP